MNGPLAHELSVASRATDFRPTLRYMIPLIPTEEIFREQVRDLLGARAHTFHDPNRKVLAFGSCFAQNISNAMIEMGRTVTTLVVTEDVNSPFNNLLLLRRIFDGDGSRFSDDLARISGIDYERTRDEMVSAQDIILTLGNVFHLEDSEGPTLHKKAHLVMESFKGTKANIAWIFDLLKANTKANIYVSVSPVPISGYRGDKFQTAVEADAASKCQLHAALRESLPFDRVTYIPTFEVFKWLALHESFESLSVSNKNPRHLRKELIRIVMEELT